MSSYKLLKQLKIIVHLVNNYSGITKQQLLDKLLDDYDFEMSARTLERHLKTLDLEFGVEIKYNYVYKGYEIGEETNEERLAEFLKFAELSLLAEFYVENLNDFERFKKYVIPEDNSAFKGLEHIKTIFEALNENKLLSFKKANYYKEGVNNYTIIPLKIKEYKNRWYLIAGLKDKPELRNFGLDRISELKIGAKHKKDIKPYHKLISAYNDIVGLNYSDFDEALKVVLKVNDNQIKYLESLPLHPSQTIGKQIDENWVEVSYYLKPNYELEVEILKMAEHVIVQEPKILRTRIETHLKAMVNNYS